MEINILNRDKWDMVSNYLPMDSMDSVYDNADILVAVDNNEVMGIMIVSQKSKEAQILHITVADEYRQKGICTRFISEYMVRCINGGVRQISCLIGFNEYDLYVYKIISKLGFVMNKAKDLIMHITVDDFIKADILQLPVKGRMIMSFNELGKEGIKQVAKTIRNNTDFDFSDNDICNANKELSFAIIKEGIIKDVIVLNDRDDCLEVTCMYSAKDDVHGVVILLRTLQDKIKNMPEYANMNVSVPSVNDASKKLVTHLIPACIMERYCNMVCDINFV